MRLQCSTAKKSQKEIGIAREADGKNYHGEEAWNAMPDDEKSMTRYLCANHTRNSPVDAFNRRFTKYLNDTLAMEFDAATKALGGRSRLEKDLPSFLRSICKLVCSGHGACAKGDGADTRPNVRSDAPRIALCWCLIGTSFCGPHVLEWLSWPARVLLWLGCSLLHAQPASDGRGAN